MRGQSLRPRFEDRMQDTFTQLLCLILDVFKCGAEADKCAAVDGASGVKTLSSIYRKLWERVGRDGRDSLPRTDHLT